MTNNIPNTQNSMVNSFLNYANELLNDSNFPQKAAAFLKTITENIPNLDFSKLTLEKQLQIENILSVQIPSVSQHYFSIPKAHAVSVIIDNGKTAKQILIDQFSKFNDIINSALQEIIQNNAKKLVENVKHPDLVKKPKKDFFDL